MQFLTQKTLERRTFLKGLSATVALPYLDAMEPARRFISGSGAAAAAAGHQRLVCIESVHGAAGSNSWGASRHLWAPEGVGRQFEFSADSALAPLQDWRSNLTIVSNTDVRMAEAFDAPEIGGDHFRSSAVFLTQSHPKQTQGLRSVRRDELRSDRRAQDRAGHADSLDAAVHRESRSGRWLHVQLFVRRTPTRSAGRRPTIRSP
ncbi:DUF1552 domain-containing protein [Gemmatimonas sp.]|uniref:DUF1552 domain-containing protein n=1 Tax=Gemmatimonas sp. TaxID=1962908 RepID=UPI003DA2DCA6